MSCTFSRPVSAWMVVMAISFCWLRVVSAGESETVGSEESFLSMLLLGVNLGNALSSSTHRFRIGSRSSTPHDKSPRGWKSSSGRSLSDVAMFLNALSSIENSFISQPLDASDHEDAFKTLHKRGWTILKDQKRMLDEETIQLIRASKFKSIFNGQKAGEKALRYVGTDESWSGKMLELFSDALTSANLLQCSDGVSLKLVNDCFALRSLPCDADVEKAAALGRQPAHSDIPTPGDKSKKLVDLADADVPLSVLLAVEPGTKLWIFPDGCQRESSAFLVHLEVGEILVWRGDLVHAGAGYALDHMRVHAYIDPPEKFFPARPKGRTNLCKPTEDDTLKTVAFAVLGFLVLNIGYDAILYALNGDAMPSFLDLYFGSEK